MSELITFAQAGAVIMACWAIISGVGAWKREFIGKRQIELAEQVLAKFFEIKDAIAMIRNSFSHTGEGNTRKKGPHESPDTAELLDRAYIVYERYARKEAIFADFNTLKYRFMATFGAQAETIFVDTSNVLNSILIASQMLGTHYWQRQGRVPMDGDEFNQHLMEMRQHEGVFWDGGANDKSDIIRSQLSAIQDNLDTIVKPCFQEPMRTYTWLTR
jgi:hypothetical protein